MNKWYRYQLSTTTYSFCMLMSTTTYLFCMAWTLFIDVSACVCNPWSSLLSFSPSYRSISWCDARMISIPAVNVSTATYLFFMAWTLFIDVSACDCNPWPSLLSIIVVCGRMMLIPAVNNNLFILHGTDFILWMFYYCDRNPWPSLLSLSPSYRSIIVVWSTNDIDISWQQQLTYFYYLSLHRMQYIPVVVYSCECNLPPTLFHFTVWSPWCFEQKVITPANNLLCGDLSQLFKCSKRSIIVGLWANVISTSGNRQLIHHCIAWSDGSTTSGEWCSNIICLTNHISQYYSIHIPKTTTPCLSANQPISTTHYHYRTPDPLCTLAAQGIPDSPVCPIIPPIV